MPKQRTPISSRLRNRNKTGLSESNSQKSDDVQSTGNYTAVNTAHNSPNDKMKSYDLPAKKSDMIRQNKHNTGKGDTSKSNIITLKREIIQPKQVTTNPIFSPRMDPDIYIDELGSPVSYIRGSSAEKEQFMAEERNNSSRTLGIDFYDQAVKTSTFYKARVCAPIQSKRTSHLQQPYSIDDKHTISVHESSMTDMKDTVVVTTPPIAKPSSKLPKSKDPPTPTTTTAPIRNKPWSLKKARSRNAKRAKAQKASAAAIKKSAMALSETPAVGEISPDTHTETIIPAAVESPAVPDMVKRPPKRKTASRKTTKSENSKKTKSSSDNILNATSTADVPLPLSSQLSVAIDRCEKKGNTGDVNVACLFIVDHY